MAYKPSKWLSGQDTQPDAIRQFEMAMGQGSDPAQRQYANELMSWIQANPQNPTLQQSLLNQYFAVTTPQQMPSPEDQIKEQIGQYTQMAQMAAAAGMDNEARQYFAEATRLMNQVGGGLPGVSAVPQAAPVSATDLGQYDTWGQIRALNQTIGGLSQDDINKYYEMEKLYKEPPNKPSWWESAIPGWGVGKIYSDMLRGDVRPFGNYGTVAVEKQYGPEEISRYKQYTDLLDKDTD
jgi:hypothetical protein